MPEQHYIFTVNKKADKIDEERRYIFHFVTASLFYLMKKERQDIETLVSFLFTSVSKSDEYYWKNLKNFSVCKYYNRRQECYWSKVFCLKCSPGLMNNVIYTITQNYTQAGTYE